MGWNTQILTLYPYLSNFKKYPKLVYLLYLHLTQEIKCTYIEDWPGETVPTEVGKTYP